MALIHQGAGGLLDQLVTSPALASSAPAFSPGNLSGLIMWCRSDLGVTHTTTVSSWADQSGNGNNLIQATTTKQPVYNATDAAYAGRPSFTFDGVDDNLRISSITYGAFTQIMAVRATTSGYLFNRDNVLDFNYGPSGPAIYISRAGVVSAKNLSSGWSVSAAPRTVTTQFDGTHAGTTLRINGTAQTLTTFSTSSNNPGTAAGTDSFAIMAGSNAAGAPSAGTVAEVLLYNRALSGSEVVQVEQYMRTLYGYY